MNMKQKELAILGGEKAIKSSLKKFNTIGLEEKNAVLEVLDTGVLSKYLGCWDEDFYGGPKVKEFENYCSKYFGVNYSLVVNSWTSGLICAIGAIDIEPGDEIIVSTWTMSASATAILHWNAIPIFADIEEKTFNISPKSVLENLSNKTKAILAIDIFGHPCNYEELMDICKKHNLILITDSAQAPGSIYGNQFTGTGSHVGGFSLNYHKHIHTGEGGILVTNDKKIYDKMSLIRNHGEAVIKEMKFNSQVNILGYNFRMGEIEASIGIEQLKKLSKIVERKQEIAEILSNGLKKIEGIRTPIIENNCTHSYYVYPLIIDKDIIKIKREKIINALQSEGIKGLMSGYANIHLLPLYQNKIAYGNSNFPWSYEKTRRNISYEKGICPVAEELNEETFIGIETCLYEYTNDNLKEIIEAFVKVFSNLNRL